MMTLPHNKILLSYQKEWDKNVWILAWNDDDDIVLSEEKQVPE